MKYKFELPESIHQAPVQVLKLEKVVRNLLHKSGIETCKELYDRIQSEDPSDRIEGVGVSRKFQIAQALKNESVVSRSQFFKFLFCWKQLIYYLLVTIGLFVVLFLSTKKKFDQDEIAVIAVSLMIMVAFDSARALRQRQLVVQVVKEIHIRSLIVILAVPIILALMTNDGWKGQEYARSILCGFAVIGVGLAYSFVFKRFFEVKSDDDLDATTFEASADIEPWYKREWIIGWIAIISPVVLSFGGWLLNSFFPIN